jgi:hypothetical protein
MVTQNVFEEEMLVLNGKIYELDWLLNHANSCMVPLLIKIWIVVGDNVQQNSESGRHNYL